MSKKLARYSRTQDAAPLSRRSRLLAWRNRKIAEKREDLGTMGHNVAVISKATALGQMPDWRDLRTVRTPIGGFRFGRDAARGITRLRRLPGPKPTMTYTIWHPETNVKKVYKGVKNKDKAHRQAMAWAKRYGKNVRLSLLSSSAWGGRAFKVTAKGKWITKQIARNPKAARKTKYTADGRGGWKLSPRSPKAAKKAAKAAKKAAKKPTKKAGKKAGKKPGKKLVKKRRLSSSNLLAYGTLSRKDKAATKTAAKTKLFDDMDNDAFFRRMTPSARSAAKQKVWKKMWNTFEFKM